VGGHPLTPASLGPLRGTSFTNPPFGLFGERTSWPRRTPENVGPISLSCARSGGAPSMYSRARSGGAPSMYSRARNSEWPSTFSRARLPAQTLLST
jgi:hypothetical protein